MNDVIVPLNLPQANLKLTKQGQVLYVWCILRQKKLVLTPEEWVRQHWIHYLIHAFDYPMSLMQAEKTIVLNGLTRRCDLVVFDRHGSPQLILECKAPDIVLNQKVLMQIAQYNAKLQVKFLILSNGIHHFVGEVNYQDAQFIAVSKVPNYQEL